MLVQILCDNPNSWIIPFALKLKKSLEHNHKVILTHVHNEITPGDILVLLSCERKFNNLHLNKHNLVVHESYLPQGKGWSPLTWQIVQGNNEIPVTLIEATDKVDSGNIYEQEIIYFNGTELIDELRQKQGAVTIELIERFVSKFPNNFQIEQSGVESFFPRRTEKDSELDIHKSIEEQFDLLRISDNERYPAYFVYKDKKYVLKIFNYDF